MAEVHVTKHVATSPDELWEHIGDFLAMGRWVRGIPPMESDDDGRVRRIGSGPNAIVEELVERGDRSYTYRILQGPLPVKNYVATLSVSPSGEGSLVEWKSTFEPDGVPEDRAVSIVQGIYTSGLANL